MNCRSDLLLCGCPQRQKVLLMPSQESTESTESTSPRVLHGSLGILNANGSGSRSGSGNGIDNANGPR
ncbi:hypothetical protein AWZ03_014400 [Drosophila navojoa]|uniref:Uncharacterized protein n=1 Tax=Drosophila navojoa TaxID=7232 RepID=A0A484AS25_DRONA|nr:hypothetical protein AWZ03_014400 [Drosophila navojoa]